MNFIEFHIGDWIKKTHKLKRLERAIYHDLLMAYYDEEGPFPTLDDVRRTVDPRNEAERQAMDYVLAKFFKHVDGKGYTHERCDEEIHRYLAKQPAAEAKREHDRERQDRARKRRRDLFAALRALGITAPYDSTTAYLERELAKAQHAMRVDNAVEDGPAHGAVTPPVTPPVTRDNTATSPQSPVPSPQLSGSSGVCGSGDVTGTHTDCSEKAAAAADAMVAAGLQVAAADAQLLALLRQGITVGELADAAAAAVKNGKPAAWAFARARNRREDAATVSLPPAPLPAAAAGASPAGKDPALLKIEQDSERAAPMPPEAREFAARLKGRTHATEPEPT